MFLICFAASASTNSGWFTRVWQTDEGLLNNNIHSIVQSRDQYVWLATPASLMRFDGARFRPFPVKEFTGSIEPHNVHILLYSRTGVLWIAPNFGKVAGLNPDFSRVTLPPGVPTNGPATMTEGSDGSLWVGYYSRSIYRIKDGQVTSFRAKEKLPGPPSLSGDGAGNIWLASGNQLYLFRNGQFEAVVRTPGIQVLTGTHTNAIWFVADAHLFQCGTNGVPQDYGAFQNSPAATADILLEDHTGSVWIGTDGNGLFRSSETGFEKIETSHSSVSALMEDREGNIWAGTRGGGLDRISLSQVRREVAEGSLPLGEIQSICEGTNGILWGATRNGVLISRTNGNWNPVLKNAEFSGTVMCVTAGRDGAIWLGTRSGNVIRLIDTNYTIWNQKTGSGDSSICALLPASSGDLWIVTSRIRRLHDGQLQDMNPMRARISAIAEDATGNVWIGAKGSVMRFDGKDFVDETPKLPLANRNICCLYGTRDGSMWISCGGAGLFRFKNDQVGRVGTEQGLFNDYISQMVADDEGWLWFGSDRGIFKIRQQELEQAVDNPAVHLRPIVYGRNEGLASLEALFSSASPFVQPRAIHSHDDRVWLLMHTGVVMAEPETLSENYPPPQVLLTQVAVDGKIIASYGNVAPTQTVANLEIPAARIPLRLPPGHRHLEFDFTAIHLGAPENVRFRYQLVGFDNDWIDSENERSAEYSRLTKGNYQFRVEACIGDGVWSETPATLSLSVAPFLWQTWWFCAGALILFTGSVIAIVRYISFRRLQMKMRMVEQRAALDKERTRIARDLHDDLGGSLNSVALSLDMMQREPPEPDSINRKIHHCSTMVRQVARSVDEIVWAINPRNDTLRYVIDYISQFAVEFMHAAEIPCRVDLPDNIPDRLLSPEARHNLFLVVKEALNNIARHARASEVRLRITTVENQIAITIEDNGRGFECAPDNASSDGLRNMRQRMEEIGGRCQMASGPGAGTRVAFLYSWPLENGQ